MDILLTNLIQIADGIAEQFGADCEVIIHDLQSENLEETIVYIKNGHVTGRKTGDGPSRVVLRSIEALERGEALTEMRGYQTRTADGRHLKSTTMYIKDEYDEYRYILGINFDITALVGARKSLQNLETSAPFSDETDGDINLNVNDLLDSLIRQSEAMIGKPPAQMTKEEKIRAIRFLDDAGAFLITRSGDKVSEYYGISKFTLYSYIDKQGKGGYTKTDKRSDSKKRA